LAQEVKGTRCFGAKIIPARGGLIELLPRYRVAEALVPSTHGTSNAWRRYLQELRDEEASGAQVIEAKRGERLDLGGGAYLDVLFPDRTVAGLETNTGCVVTRLVYGETAFMLPCDSPNAIENYLVLLDGANLHANVLKAGHHGSKTSASALFVGMVNPTWAVYSRGCNNTYGHPSPETVELFARFNIPTVLCGRVGQIT
jgi:competence protein ComEC